MRPEFVAAEATLLREHLWRSRPAWPGRHQCADHMVEVGTGPDHNGVLVLAETCELCGKVLRSYRDSVL